MKHFGNTVVVWDLHTLQPKKIFDVPGAPLEIRCAWGANHNYCFTATALTSKIWLIYRGRSRRVAGEGRRRHRRRQQNSAAGRHLDLGRRRPAVGRYVERRQGAPVRHPRPARAEADLRAEDRRTAEHGVAKAGTASACTSRRRCSRTGTRPRRPAAICSSSSCTRGTARRCKPQFNIDFVKEKLGSPHQMRFGAYSLYGQKPPAGQLAQQ